jgi:hypothetical protein
MGQYINTIIKQVKHMYRNSLEIGKGCAYVCSPPPISMHDRTSPGTCNQVPAAVHPFVTISTTAVFSRSQPCERLRCIIIFWKDRNTRTPCVSCPSRGILVWPITFATPVESTLLLLLLLFTPSRVRDVKTIDQPTSRSRTVSVGASRRCQKNPDV